MDTILSQQLKKQKENNPHKRLHAIVFGVVVACLTAQVIEGAFIIPYILIHFGWPQLSMKEVCDEMYFIVYKDDERECNFPHPLFAGPEPWKYKDMTGVIGRPVPPRPRYEGFGFRETIKRREERMARKAAEAAAAEQVAETNAGEQGQQGLLSRPTQESDTEGITAGGATASTTSPADQMSN